MKLSANFFSMNGVGLLLILLSFMSYFLAEGKLQMPQQTSLLLLLAVCKCFLIGAVFMELIHNHKLILLAFTLFFALLGGLLSMLFVF